MIKKVKVLLALVPVFSIIPAHAQLPLESRIYMKDGTAYRYFIDDKDVAAAERALSQQLAEEATAPLNEQLQEFRKIEAQQPLTAQESAAEAALHEQIEKARDDAKKEADEAYDNKVPDGFGGLDFAGTSAGAEVRVTPIRYNIHYSAKGSLPFYLMMVSQAERVVDADQSSRNLMDRDGGLLNIKIADDVWQPFSKPGNGPDVGKRLCDFRGSDVAAGFGGGCYLNLQAGVKVFNYVESSATEYDFAGYASVSFAFEFPISKGENVRRPAKAGRVIGALGVSGFSATTDNVAALFPEVAGIEDMDKRYAVADAGLRFTIDNKFSLLAEYKKPLGNEELFEETYSLSLSYSQ